MNTSIPFSSSVLGRAYDYLAPDQSEIRLLLSMNGGGLCHCTLPPGKTSSAVMHQSVEEIWYFLSGEGVVWRKSGDQEEVTAVKAGSCVTIPARTRFQFRNSGSGDLTFLIATMPPWPGAHEATAVDGRW